MACAGVSGRVFLHVCVCVLLCISARVVRVCASAPSPSPGGPLVFPDVLELVGDVFREDGHVSFEQPHPCLCEAAERVKVKADWWAIKCDMGRLGGRLRCSNIVCA